MTEKLRLLLNNVFFTCVIFKISYCRKAPSVITAIPYSTRILLWIRVLASYKFLYAGGFPWIQHWPKRLFEFPVKCISWMVQNTSEINFDQIVPVFTEYVNSVVADSVSSTFRILAAPAQAACTVSAPVSFLELVSSSASKENSIPS